MLRSESGAVLVLCVLLFSGCASLVPLALDPVGTTNQVISDSVQSLTQPTAGIVDQNSGVSDINRILSENPDAENAASLRELRDQLSLRQAPVPQAQSADSPKREYQAEHDRRLSVPFFRNTQDRLQLDTASQFDQPRGIRNTPFSSASNETLSAPLPVVQSLDFTPVRFNPGQ
jgi:hypothetical protein